MNYLRITKLTPAQFEILNWAADAMKEFWTDPERDENCTIIEHPIKMSKPGTCEIAASLEVLEDLEYRLLVQLPDMADGEHTSQLAAARRVFKKIEEEFSAQA